MATAEGPARAHDRNSRRRPFSAWMKRLANLKNSSSNTPSTGISLSKRNTGPSASKSKPSGPAKNNPYPESGRPAKDTSHAGNVSFSTPPSRRTASLSPATDSQQSLSSADGHLPQTTSNKSAAPTVSTNPDTTHSDAAHSSKADSSLAATNATIGGCTNSHGGAGSTFSSPAPSVRSLTTTLTTIQSTAPSTLLPGGANSSTHHSTATPQPIQAHQQQSSHHAHPSDTNIHFTHQFPSSPPASAIPTHLAPQSGGGGGTGSGNPTTYSTATANNLLTDNASILTLASSSKRRRRRSMDTDASVRALAPSSLWGGSRESLPLSVLSGNADAAGASPTGVLQGGRPSVSGIANPERASVYSSSGIAPILSSERNSYYAGKAGLGSAGGPAADGGSVKSGLLSHGRNDSITGSIGGVTSPTVLTSPPSRDISGVPGAMTPGGPLTRMSSSGTGGRPSRRNSGWREPERGEENEGPERGDAGAKADGVGAAGIKNRPLER
ncbi:MAG: hypothetical protein M1817_003966 [Caeruleum heppii]|nr:MAG: hypothetical protein M1817_003966 [Caeruleum heppii]